ncbi:26S proteasome non-ATPase regulatory subunit 4 homolog isoform X2 [Tanacetum coccineum]
MEAEATMIVIDNSDYVRKDNVFKTQLEAVRLYCRAKIKSEPKNRVGLGFMNDGFYLPPHKPTSDIEHFLTHTIGNISYGGELYLIGGVQSSLLGFSRLPKDMKKRMLVFVAGHGYMMDYILRIGERLKEDNVALDVVSFADEDPEFDTYKTKCLQEFVVAANKDNNSHFARVPPHSSVRDILVSSKILSSSEAEAVPSAEEEIKKRTGNRSKMNPHSKDLEEEAKSSPPLAIFPDSVQAF